MDPITGSGEAKTVLVVDDDPDVRQVVSWALEDAGFEVHTAPDGYDALSRASTHPPAVVVLDVGLPNADGTLVAARLREVCGQSLPIVVMTADGRAAEKARRAGAFAYLHKPFEDQALIETVRRGLTIT
ncbi:MAG: response regulator [Chloroflexi bacterium]|nr:response regulator [Chloroflexota bacterium]